MVKLSRRNRETRAVLRRYNPARLARLALSEAAVGIADEAMRLATTHSEPEDWSRYSMGDHLGDGPRRLLEAAEDLMTLTVFYARTQGKSWEDIGDYLGVSKQTAHERFEARVARLEALLYTPFGADDVDDPPFGYIPSGVFPVTDPEEVGARLDAQVAAWRAADGEDRHDDDPERTAHPVTTGLPVSFPLQVMKEVMWREERWAEDHPEVRADAEFMAGLLETKAEVLQGIADEARADNQRLKSVRQVVSTFSDGAAGARARAAELRASLPNGAAD